MALTFYFVKFFFVVGNPDSADADLVTTATVTGCIGLECPDDYYAALNVRSSSYQYTGYTLYDSETDTVELLEDVHSLSH